MPSIQIVTLPRFSSDYQSVNSAYRFNNCYSQIEIADRIVDGGGGGMRDFIENNRCVVGAG